MTFNLPAGAAEIIVRKKAQYCRLVDTKELSQMDKVLLPDFTFITVDMEGTIVNLNNTDLNFMSQADWIAYFNQMLTSVQTMHLVSYPELELVAPDEIKAIFGVTYHVGTKEFEKGVHWTGGGYYFETWKLKDGDWFIKAVKLVRTFWKETTV